MLTSWLTFRFTHRLSEPFGGGHPPLRRGLLDSLHQALTIEPRYPDTDYCRVASQLIRPFSDTHRRAYLMPSETYSREFPEASIQNPPLRPMRQPSSVILLHDSSSAPLHLGSTTRHQPNIPTVIQVINAVFNFRALKQRDKVGFAIPPYTAK